MKVKLYEGMEGVYVVELEDGSSRLATRNLVPSIKVYGEPLIRYEGVEFRVWDAYRSKLAAAFMKGLKTSPLREGLKVLYLGAASGTTCSHVSDIVGHKGRVYGVEFSPRVMREFLERVVKYRKNVMPILADARLPAEYAHMVEEVDIIYQDVAQPYQSKILVDNADFYLKRGGWAFLAIKARSIDVTKEPSEVYRRELEVLKNGGFEIVHVVHLEPYDVDHAMILTRRV
ncbi:MAG: fibrillarin-like rRNA/tRNA 2'-O-methyltransferase [Candidatus Nezhaarchaeota archaeon]|nr:fibrillarin-like rRNA/tRNA 2'-O-methyltransferase [Candidatus Nezhaarchaeota archaeon]MCX8141978.1 fibrillarin-like rRNA/tRNA 2'-O-methyltransferase [Candidatus Nezhaarchaeota archaeon]MDW8050241.1 fibrillarin-like rRNA/tRNA 2'-O-methyltransferase [Nitrososphaerota archaeon]